MADDADNGAKSASRGGALKWIAVLVLGLGLGAGGFYVMFTGAADDVLAWKGESDTGSVASSSLTFLELEPIIVSIGGPGSIRNLRFRASLQIAPDADSLARSLQPRMMDIATTYLRAVPMDMLEEPTSLIRIRAQLLRRFQMLTGPDAVEDLLVSEFVMT
ncbi:flagellar basal body-associated protein FliL [uncultured Jannaschia sp.]|uniref:flagellar basal body-associated FliL family protein n=1 Tax=uncultured Jannaschia sp. TaxID=293347 RepID=UPI00260C848F|nr:flagellar basal body-associated FliL family protein [uncultured Jannaschia sp.]